MLPFRNRPRTYKIGSHKIRLRMPKDMSHFAGEEGKKFGVSSEALPLFGVVWASSEILSHLLLDIDITGKRILEVGCGMALVSHLLNNLGADITAMDIHPVKNIKSRLHCRETDIIFYSCDRFYFPQASLVFNSFLYPILYGSCRPLFVEIL